MAFLPSASRLPIAKHCAFAWSPHAPRWPKRPQRDDAEVGIAVHAEAEAAANGEASTPLARELAESLEGLTDRLPEQPYAYDVKTGRARRLVKAGHRSYVQASDDELTGTADLVYTSRDGRRVVRDYKSGDDGRWLDPKTNMQLRFLALAVARSEGLDEIDVEITGLTSMSGADSTPPATFDVFHLAEIAAEVADIYKASTSAETVPRSGQHCRWCPIREVCPETAKALAKIAMTPGPAFPMAVASASEISGAEHAAFIKRARAVYEDALDAASRAADDWIRDNGPIPWGEGVWYGLVEKSRETIALTPEATEFLQREAPAALTVEVSTSKSAIAKAIGRRESLHVLDHLRELGAVKTSKWVQNDKFRKSDDAAE